MTTNANTNANIEIFSERIKFYADTPIEKNKYFCFKITSILALKEALWRFFDKGWNIRSAYYERIDLSTGEIMENAKINVQKEMEEYVEAKLSKRF